ncbi:MAG: hypothetical protein NTW29_20880 [Bacteroidetes bacterium]|nr:hypothetical protein [Bacteroidota bacterium]
MRTFSYAPETLHIALVSLPQHDEQRHTNALIEDLYNSYLKDIQHFSNLQTNKDEYLYKPLGYFILGNYDIALISLVNNYKFAQKQLTPRQGTKLTFFSEPNSYQVITGSCPIIKTKFSPKDFFIEKQKKAENFICISNLKINNKLLIGSGNQLFQGLLLLIDELICKEFKVPQAKTSYNYFLQQSYSWFEITLVIFSQEITRFSKILTSIRNLTLNDLVNNPNSKLTKKGVLKNSLYETLLHSPNNYRDINPHLFADTHSYFGVHFSYIEKSPPKKPVELKTQIEWQVKPGHFTDLLNELRVSLGEDLFTNNNFILTGKTDYYIQEQKDYLDNNIQLLKALKTNPKIFNFARKVKTRVLLSHKPDSITNPHQNHHPSFKNWLREKHLVQDNNTLNEYSRILKKLKISRNVRNKINKIYYNYNNGIQDPILFTYFLDFSIFIENLTLLIQEENSKFEKAFASMDNWGDFEKKSVYQTENLLVEKIEIFDEGYRIRMLNCHNYEDITDFDLDFNSSVQQLLSTYNTLCAHISNLFFSRHSHGPVVQLYLKNTVSNYETINYDVYHLTSPEFVFFTLVKEVLNKFVYADHELTRRKNKEKGERKKSIQDIIDLLKNEVIESRLRDYFENELIDFEYYFLDAIKYIHTCNLDFDLYQYWFWTYNFQNAALYDRVGTFNEEHFKKELARLVFLACLFDEDLANVECPIPEIYFLWERHSKSIKANVRDFINNSRAISTFKLFVLSAFQYPNLNSSVKATKSQNAHAFNKYWSLIAKLDTDDYSALPIGKLQNISNVMIHMDASSKPIIQSLQKGQPVYCVAKDLDSYTFLNSFIHAYLKLIYEKNGKKVRLLRRDWENGDPLLSFIQSGKKNYLYYVDQFGGIFLPDNFSSSTYFSIRNAALQSLWHYALLYKKQLLTNLKNDERAK